MATKSRAVGYYWIRLYDDGVWSVGQFNGRMWQVSGHTCHFIDEELAEIQEKPLVPPQVRKVNMEKMGNRLQQAVREWTPDYTWNGAEAGHVKNLAERIRGKIRLRFGKEPTDDEVIEALKVFFRTLSLLPEREVEYYSTLSRLVSGFEAVFALIKSSNNPNLKKMTTSEQIKLEREQSTQRRSQISTVPRYNPYAKPTDSQESC